MKPANAIKLKAAGWYGNLRPSGAVHLKPEGQGSSQVTYTKGGAWFDRVVLLHISR